MTPIQFGLGLLSGIMKGKKTSTAAVAMVTAPLLEPSIANYLTSGTQFENGVHCVAYGVAIIFLFLYRKRNK